MISHFSGCGLFEPVRLPFFGIFRLVVLGVLLEISAGCGTFRHDRHAVPLAADNMVSESDLALAAVPAPVAAVTPVADVAGDAENYLIHPGDALNIQVRGEEDLSGDYKVSSEGVIVYSFLGRIAVAGLSSAMVESNLTASLGKDYLVNPKINVQVRSSILRRVILFGEVKSPGVYEIPVGERFTLLQVIAKAGGLTDLAATDRARIVRRAGATEKVIKVNVTDLLNGRGESRDIELQPNDVITIPQTIF